MRRSPRTERITKKTFLQGINVLPGSFMTGQTRWAIYGVLCVMVGVGLVIAASRQTR